MNDTKIPVERDLAYFQEIYRDGGFWSCCGYDGLSVAFDVPLESFRSLPEDQKHALMRLLGRLAKMGDESLIERIRGLHALSAPDRLTGLVDLSARFAA